MNSCTLFLFLQKFFFLFFLSKAEDMKHCLRLTEAFLQIYTFQNIYFRLYLLTHNLDTVTASYLTHPNVNVLYFLFSCCIFCFPRSSQFDQQHHFKVQRAMWNQNDYTDILL